MCELQHNQICNNRMRKLLTFTTTLCKLYVYKQYFLGFLALTAKYFEENKNIQPTALCSVQQRNSKTYKFFFLRIGNNLEEEENKSSKCSKI